MYIYVYLRRMMQSSFGEIITSVTIILMRSVSSRFLFSNFVTLYCATDMFAWTPFRCISAFIDCRRWRMARMQIYVSHCTISNNRTYSMSAIWFHDGEPGSKKPLKWFGPSNLTVLCQSIRNTYYSSCFYWLLPSV